MKNILTLLIITLISFSNLVAQNNSTKKADRLFDRFEFVKAAEEYLKLANDEANDYYVISRLADSYYNIFDTKNAEKWFEKIVEENDSEIIYKYAQMLKANGKYKESNIWMTKFSEMKPYDSRAVAFRNTPNYIDKIIEKGKKFNIQNLSINSEYSDFGSTMFNNKLYFISSEEPGFLEKPYSWSNEGFLNIYSSYINENGSYLERVEFDDLNSKYHEGVITFMADGNTAYFTRESYFEKEYEKSEDSKTKYSQLYIYRASKKNGKWLSIESLKINDQNYSNKNPMIGPKGEYLYFSSNMPGGYGQYDIYKAKINEDGSIGDPLNLGQKINTEGQEGFPFMSEDKIIYFSSDGHLGLGGLDVFYSKNIDTKWSNVRNVGIPVNSGADDFAFMINGDDGYISSNRPGGKGSDDIYAVKKLLPLCDILFTTNIIDSKTKESISSATTSISDNTGIIDNTKMTSEKGLTEFMLECEDQIQLMVSKTGYESKMLDLKFSDIDPPVLDIYLDPIEEIIVEEKIMLNPIYFDFDKSNITNQAAFELDKLVALMEKYPDMIIRAESHTDARGPATYNRGLSDRRAKSTAQYVISKGISEDRISGVGKGEDEPKIDCSQGCSKEEHAQNRRSEFIIVSR
ncbi:MAG: OmpA family protein [Flavobacteriaceae bacterium]|jgi:outer membrane protein OmpA-like peptidoglycan-associated protein|nr:OmpA family protein [Flavobacteriaceae bacterium]